MEGWPQVDTVLAGRGDSREGMKDSVSDDDGRESLLWRVVLVFRSSMSRMLPEWMVVVLGR